MNPEIEIIISPVELAFPNGDKKRFENGAGACAAVFEKRYVVKEMKAVNSTVVIVLKYLDEDTNWIKEHTARTGVEPNLFDGV